MHEIELEIDEYNTLADCENNTIILSNRFLESTLIEDITTSIIHETLHIVLCKLHKEINNTDKCKYAEDCFQDETLLEEIERQTYELYRKT